MRRARWLLKVPIAAISRNINIARGRPCYNNVLNAVNGRDKIPRNRRED